MKSGFDIADMIDYKISNNKGLRYIFIIIDNFSKYLWAIPHKNNFSRTITNFQIFYQPQSESLLNPKVIVEQNFIIDYFKIF